MKNPFDCAHLDIIVLRRYLVHWAAPTGPWTSTVTSSYTLVIHDKRYEAGFSLKVASSSNDRLVQPSIFFNT